MDVIISITLVVFGILQIILFFKLWDMTTDVREIKDALIKIHSGNIVKVGADLDGWAVNVSETEKMEAMPFINTLIHQQVIAKVISKNKMEVWSLKFWESEQNNADYKLIYKS